MFKRSNYMTDDILCAICLQDLYKTRKLDDPVRFLLNKKIMYFVQCMYFNEPLFGCQEFPNNDVIQL